MTWIPPPCYYIPFNGGPRICLGQNFALTEMEYATARLCQAFSLVEERSVGTRGPQRLKTDVIITPVGGVQVSLIPIVST